MSGLLSAIAHSLDLLALWLVFTLYPSNQPLVAHLQLCVFLSRIKKKKLAWNEMSEFPSEESVFRLCRVMSCMRVVCVRLRCYVFIVLKLAFGIIMLAVLAWWRWGHVGAHNLLVERAGSGLRCVGGLVISGQKGSPSRQIPILKGLASVPGLGRRWTLA